MKKFSIVFFIFLLIFTNLNLVYADDYDEELDETDLELIETVAPVNSEVKLNSRAAIVLERNSQTVLYEKNSDSPRPMASTTKIMTCIIVLQNADLSKIVTISKKAANVGGSKIGLKTGDKITIHDLLFGLMLKSGNDAAIALAEEVGGNVENFAEMMNNKAKELGLVNTHFVTPHGLDASEHYTTAKELALLTNYALNIPKFKEIVGIKSYNLTINNQPRTINNTNELLGYLSGVYGVKTGFTNGAGRCLVTSTKRNDMDIICVVLGADTKKNRSQDSMKLIEYAFKNFQLIDLEDKFYEMFNNFNANNKISILKGIKSYAEIGLKEAPTLTSIRNEDINNIEFCIDFVNNLTSPVEKNRIIGSIYAKIDDNVLLQQDLYVKYDIPKKGFIDYMFEIIKNYSSYLQKVF